MSRTLLLTLPLALVAPLSLTSCSDGGGIDLLCGDGEVNGTEECDDGNKISGDGCSSSCTDEPAVCGNGTVERGEGCDDGNQTVEYNGCTDTCQRAAFTFINYYNADIAIEVWTGADLNYNGGLVQGSNLYEEMSFNTLASGAAHSQTLNQGNEELLVILGIDWNNDPANRDWKLFLERTYTNHAAGNVYILDSNGQLSVQSNLYNINYGAGNMPPAP